MRFNNVLLQLSRIIFVATVVFFVFAASKLGLAQASLDENTMSVLAVAGILIGLVMVAALFGVVSIGFTQRLLSDLRRECKVATTHGQSGPVSNGSDAVFRVRRLSKGEYSLEMMADQKNGITWILGKHALEGCDQYAHNLKVSRGTVIAMVDMLKGHNAKQLTPDTIRKEIEHFHKERAKLGVNLRDEARAVEAEKALMGTGAEM